MTAQNKNLHDRIKKLIEVIGTGLYEKEEAVRLGLLTALAGESMFLLGAPGCAKSMIARRIKEAFKSDGDGQIQYFETLLNQFTTPEEVFGNISLKALNGELEDQKGKEEYRRLTDGMLPEADIAFLDEIWKASPAILNTLLTIVNERKFKNGSKLIDVPLKALFAASNELPAKDCGLEALYDRFILRLAVGFIQDENSFFEMIEQPASKAFSISEENKNLLIGNNELKEWASAIDRITLSEAAKNVVTAIRKELVLQNDAMTDAEKADGEAFEVGDRRWKKIAHILKTSAFLNDRTEVDLMDCSLIEHCIWSTEKQQKKAREIIEKCLKENGLDCDTAIEDIEDKIEDFKNAIDSTWYEEKTTEPTDKIVTLDGQKCYECTKDGTNEIWYVTVERGYHGYSNQHDIYNDKKQHYSYDYFKKDGDKIDCNYNFTINKNPGKKYKEPIKLSDIAHYTLQKNFDRDNYKPIANSIKTEIERLKKQKEEDSVPFRANLFANQEYNTLIAAKIDEAVRILEDSRITLEKERNKYFKEDLSPKLSVGDVILSDDRIVAPSEIQTLSDAEKESVVAVVCITGEKTYALGVTQYKDEWDANKDAREKYAESLPEEYSKDWMIPKKELLHTMWENRKAINKSLKEINKTTLSEKEYWSYSENDDKSAAYYQVFDKDGKQDYTTKDHSYSFCLIREWKNL